DLQATDKSNGRDRFTGTFRSQWRPLNWLTGESSVGYDQAAQNFKSFVPVGYTNSSNLPNKGSLYELAQNNRSYNVNASLTSVREFMQSVRNTTKLAALYEDQTNAFTDINASQLTLPKVPEFGAADPSGTIRPGSRTEVIRAQNVFLVTTFDIKDRYIVDGLIRRDESSLFGSKQRTQVYHRLSGAW